MGYPGIVLDPAGAAVEGFVFSSGHLFAHWARLDAFEGEGYHRVLAPVQLGNGTTVDACIYALPGDDRRSVRQAAADRSEERRVGKECVSPCRSRWSPYP